MRNNRFINHNTKLLLEIFEPYKSFRKPVSGIWVLKYVFNFSDKDIKFILQDNE